MIEQHQHQAFEMQKFAKPLSKRFFYVCARWAALVMALAAIGVMLSGCDSNAADLEDAEALSSREWAGQQVCGPDATPVWRDTTTLECLPTRPVMAVE